MVLKSRSNLVGLECGDFIVLGTFFISFFMSYKCTFIYGDKKIYAFIFLRKINEKKYSQHYGEES